MDYYVYAIKVQDKESSQTFIYLSGFTFETYEEAISACQGKIDEFTAEKKRVVEVIIKYGRVF